MTPNSNNCLTFLFITVNSIINIINFFKFHKHIHPIMFFLYRAGINNYYQKNNNNIYFLTLRTLYSNKKNPKVLSEAMIVTTTTTKSGSFTWESRGNISTFCNQSCAIPNCLELFRNWALNLMPYKEILSAK